MVDMRYAVVSLVLVAAALTGCGRAAEEPDGSVAVDCESAALDTSYPGAPAFSDQLLLGTLQLEGTEHAVMPEQAQSLLPLWQALQGGVTAEAELNAVLKQIEATMTEEQLKTIAAMRLTEENVQSWMEEQGLGAGAGFRGAVGMNEEEREAMRATRQAESAGAGARLGEEMPPELGGLRAQFENMSEEEREAMMATARADGLGSGFRGAGRDLPELPEGDLGQTRLFLRPLIELLSDRAAEDNSS